jgi:hypothetical protein
MLQRKAKRLLKIKSKKMKRYERGYFMQQISKQEKHQQKKLVTTTSEQEIMGNPVFVAIDLSDQNMMRDTFWSRAIRDGVGLR